MKRKIFIVLFAIIAAVAGIFCACKSNDKPLKQYSISLNTEKSYILEVGDEIDFTQYFIVTDDKGHRVLVTDDMLDLSEVDTSAPGSFTVTITIEDSSTKATFTVIPKTEENPPTEPSEPTKPSKSYQISLNTEKSFIIEQGAEVDFTQYFIVKDENGYQIMVTEDMLDLSKADTSVPGPFAVTLTIGNSSATANFTVVPKKEDPTTPKELAEIFEKYADMSKWNFAITLTQIGEGETSEDYYEYLGYNVLNRYTDNYGYSYTDYLGYDASADLYYFYSDNGDGTYEKYAEDTDEFAECFGYLYLIDLSQLVNFTFVADGDGYVAVNPKEAGNAVIYDYGSAYYWQNLTVYIANGKITKVIGLLSDGYAEQYELSKQGTVNFILPTVSTTDPNDPTDPTDPTDPSTPDELSAIFANYKDMSKWNFAVNLTLDDGKETYVEYYEYLGYNILNKYLADDDNYYTDYLGYNASTDTYYYYEENTDGTYSIYAEGTDDFYDCYSYLYIIDLSVLNNFVFVKADDGYSAKYPGDAGNAVLGEYVDSEWFELTVYVENGKITGVVGIMEDGYTFRYELSRHGLVSFTLPTSDSGSGDSGSGGDTTPPSGSVTVTVSIASYASANNWKDATQYATVKADSFITITASGKENTGKYYSNSKDWRIYQSESATLSFKAASGCTIISIKVTYNPNNNGVLTGGSAKYTSGTTISVNANSVTFGVGNTGSATNGQVRITAIEVVYSGGSGGTTSPSDVMEAQTYNPSTFDKSTLHDKMIVDDSIGLPSTGTYSALVIPVQFKGDTITQTQLSNLEIAFNGTEAQTGWESVKTYYQKASYGKLNLSFDIQPVYQAKYNASYYEGQNYGDEVVLLEALAYYESRLDLTKYDVNDDGCIDAVYLIYSESVDYDNADFFWAFTTWYSDYEEFDGLYPYYYFFAGFDFMDESTANDKGSGYDRIPGLKVNAATYIHETGHLLGLDDYYDYYEDAGANEGLGGADMMDYTVGDHNVYSKIMLGWLEPTIVNSTQTVTIQSSAASASAILIPLNFNNSYFCEYLLIDLYSAQGLNALHASVNGSYLYDGASYGVRIYHVSSSINNPYGDDYGSFTDNNNSISDIALIKLVEADGEKKFASTGGLVAESDLWQTGGSLSEAFPAYTRNDGKKVNFDISIVSVSATEATITITFN